MQATHFEKKEKTFILLPCWGWKEPMICVLLTTTLNSRVTWTPSRTAMIEVDYCSSLTFSNIKIFMFVCSVLDWWTRWWINQRLLFLIFIDSPGVSIFGARREDGKWLNSEHRKLSFLMSKNLFDATINIEFPEEVLQGKSIWFSLPLHFNGFFWSLFLVFGVRWFMPIMSGLPQ